jgi:hypothetical protein
MLLLYSRSLLSPSIHNDETVGGALAERGQAPAQVRRALGNVGKQQGEHRPGWGKRAGQQPQRLGSANNEDGTSCTGRQGATIDEGETNDDGGPPSARRNHPWRWVPPTKMVSHQQQGQALKDDG